MATVGVLAFALVGCGPGTDTPTAGSTDGTGSRESSPFTAGPPPAGYEPVVAGTGTQGGEWGEDSTGTDEPYTVLARGSDVVIVSITGFEGYQGGIDQASKPYGAEDVESFAIDGKDARFVPASTHWADLVAVRGDDLAVRVTAPDATRDELVEILERVEVGPDRTSAPSVPDPPDGLETVGSVDVDGLVAAGAFVDPRSSSIPGPASAHGVGWLAPGTTIEGQQVAVLTIPEGSVDLAAVPHVHRRFASRTVTSHDREVAGRPAAVVEWTDGDEGYGGRSVWVESAWGDVVVVTATGTPPAGEEELVTLAASVQPTDETGWEAFVVEATGGPGLHADEGRTELARGQAGDLEWLLQNGLSPSVSIDDPNLPATDDPRGVDPCLKLSNRRRVCASNGGGTTDDWIRSAGASDGFPAFVVVSTTREGAALRVTTDAAEATVPLVAVPGGGLWGAAAVIDGAGMSICQGPPGMTVPESVAAMRIDLLDAQGAVIGCLGQGG